MTAIRSSEMNIGVRDDGVPSSRRLEYAMIAAGLLLVVIALIAAIV
jgi:hypothetical protein